MMPTRGVTPRQQHTFAEAGILPGRRITDSSSPAGHHRRMSCPDARYDGDRGEVEHDDIYPPR
jgi:hypothetical protein